MKTLRITVLLAFVLAIVLAIDQHSTAQSTNVDRGALGQYEQLMLYLSKHGDSNTVAQVDDFLCATAAEREATELAIDVRVLNDFRKGKTNDALRLLETRVDGALVVFGTPPAGFKHEPKYDKILKQAKEYRGKYPYKSGSQEIDAAVARAFDSIGK